MNLTKFLLSPFLLWLPMIFMGVAFLLGGFLYFKEINFAKVFGKEPYRLLKWLVGFVAVFRILYAVILTAGQYYIWSKSGASKIFLTLPIDKHVPIPGFLVNILSKNKLGYFIFYSFGRFWLDAVISLVVAFGFYVLLKLLEKYKQRFFVRGEAELGLASSLIVGWPNFVIFLPLIFLFVVLLSILNAVFSKTKYTTLGIPFLLAAAVVLIFGSHLIATLGLGVLDTSNQIIGSLL